MKELSIEERAQRYDEALEKARQLCVYPTTKPFISDLQDLFPELKEEQEDEKIRKEIIDYIKTGTYHKSWIAWLEKQKDCVHIKKDWFEHLKQSWYKEGFIDGKYSGGTSKERAINDATILKELIGFLENETPKLQHDITQYANWLKIQFAPNEKQGEQKPAWTPMDEQRVENLLAIIEGHGYPGEVAWLNSLKDRVHPKSQWKPSEEQMDALEQFISEYKDIDDNFRAYPISHNIESLYNDLKKLIE